MGMTLNLHASDREVDWRVKSYSDFHTLVVETPTSEGYESVTVFCTPAALADLAEMLHDNDVVRAELVARAKRALLERGEVAGDGAQSAETEHDLDDAPVVPFAHHSTREGDNA